MVEDQEMGGADEVKADEESDDGSEDLEGESSGSEGEEEDLEEEDADEAMEIDGGDKPANGAAGHHDEIMSH